MLYIGTIRLYTKQALSISEQIDLLNSRGLNIVDSFEAAKFLGEVSYFRFVQYLRPFFYLCFFERCLCVMHVNGLGAASREASSAMTLPIMTNDDYTLITR